MPQAGVEHVVLYLETQAYALEGPGLMQCVV